MFMEKQQYRELIESDLVEGFECEEAHYDDLNRGYNKFEKVILDKQRVDGLKLYGPTGNLRTSHGIPWCFYRVPI